jgi:hypothetical protein
MDENAGSCGVINLSDWRERRPSQERTPLEGYALDRCEATLNRRAWDSFAYWHAIYVPERGKS